MMSHTIQNAYLSVTVAEHGAELQSILGADGTEFLWQGDPKYWKDRALNIFPYVARLTNGSYYMDGQLYHMDIHGFAPYKDFAVAEKSQEKLVLELTDSEDTYRQYPRHFAFRIGYQLLDNRLEVSFQVENRDEKCMYFGLGGHPGFNVPLEKGLAFEDYRLRFSEPCKPRRVLFDPKTCFRTGETAPFALEEDTIVNLRHGLLDDDAIVLQDMPRTVTIESAKGSHSVTVEFPQIPYVGFWHWPKTDAPYICIEPWCSLPSLQDQIAVFEQQEDLISLEPGKTYQNVWSIPIQ